jgi:hypothetical protein
MSVPTIFIHPFDSFSIAQSLHQPHTSNQNLHHQFPSSFAAFSPKLSSQNSLFPSKSTPLPSPTPLSINQSSLDFILTNAAASWPPFSVSKRTQSNDQLASLQLCWSNLFFINLLFSHENEPFFITRLSIAGHNESNLSAWDSSSHGVFIRMSAVFTWALDFFQRKETEIGNSCVFWAFQALISWAHTFRFVFDAPCAKCGRVLVFDSDELKLLPPVARTLPNFDDRGEIMEQNVSSVHLQCLDQREREK